MSECYIGIMSGTSLDGIDVVLVDLDEGCRLINCLNVAFSSELYEKLKTIINSEQSDLIEIGRCNVELSVEYANAVNSLISKSKIDKQSIVAIGSHGQTVLHCPEHQFSVQLGSGSVLAEKTGITVVNDFRSRDMAAGGEGAPLVPAFHHKLYSDPLRSRLIINIGGISNCSWLPTDSSQIQGFDIGPGNTLIDSWIQLKQNKSFDEGGSWGKSGEVNLPLLNEMKQDPYFEIVGPRSTGREYFNLNWLSDFLNLNEFKNISDVDIQATLTELTAWAIAGTIIHFAPDESYICGGGLHNHFLIKRIEQLSKYSLSDISTFGINSDYVEAAAFAWFAKQCMKGESLSLSTITGATGNRICGAIYQA